MKFYKTVFIILILAFLPLQQASAHKVILFAWVEDGMIFTQGSFGSKRKAKDCVITVFDENGQVVHTGRTDAQGEYAFKIPNNIVSDLLLKLEAGTGHQAQWTIPETELLSVPSAIDIADAKKNKATMENSPSVLKILSGIALIFFLALALKYLKRK